MQLAATPRPHPPPVPPRPSRQVVAEALKRSPRPPCPTRQAPPPPDTKPWRAKNNSSSEKENCVRGGSRTVVYDSGGKTTNGEVAADEESAKKSGEENIKDSAIIARRVEENVNKQQQLELNVVATLLTQSERNDRNATNFSCGGFNPTPPSPSSYSDSPSHSHSPSSSPVIKPTPPTPAERHHQQIISHSNLRVHQIRQGNSPSEPPPPDPKLIISQSLQAAKLVKHQRNIQVVKGAVIFEAENHNLVKSIVESKETDAETTNARKIVNDSEFGNKCFEDSSSSAVLSASNETHEEEKEGDERSILDSRLENYQNEERMNKDSNSSSSNISSDDCATVVQVVDEQERRVAFEDSVNIQHEDWLEAGVRYSSTKITLSGDEKQEDTFVNGFHGNEDDELISTFDFDSIKEKIAMSSLQGLPPLPRSLSGFNLNATPTRESNEPPPPPARSSSRPQRGTRPTQPTGRPPPPPQGGRQLTTLDTQLAKLRREMFGLRQLDLSLLSQLWSLNESIQEFRQLLQEQDDRAPSPSPSSEEGDDTSYGSHPPPHPRRPPPVSHHHRTPRPPPRNDSPSSEEYGAV